jgi:thiosulfate/3-mercaptopyruvate sulfurtransferase
MIRANELAFFILLAGQGVLVQASPYRHPDLLVETSELATILSSPDVRLLDARPAPEYRSGHLPGAVNLPAPLTDDLEANRHGYPIYPEKAMELFRAAGLNNSSRAIVYDDQRNRFAARIFYVLEFFGQHHVQVLNGGIKKWQAEGRPLTAEIPVVTPGNFTPQPSAADLVNSQWVEQHLKDAKVKLVDARTPAEYAGRAESGARAGHIPGAVNIEWTRMITPGEVHTFLDASVLEKTFVENGVTPNSTVVTYCLIGMRASEVYFALRLLGYEHVRMYDGSWEDWSAIPNLPVQP